MLVPNRPLKVFSYVVVAVGLIMVGRLLQRSVFQHTYYITLAKQQQNTQLEIQAQRGIIYAQDAEQAQPVILAESVNRYAVSVTPRYVKNPAKIIPILSTELKLSEEELTTKLTYNGTTAWPAGKGNYTPPLAHGLTKDEVEALAKKLDPNTPVRFDSSGGDIIYFTEGLFFVREFQRIYPENQLASQVLGYVNFEGQGQYGFEEYHSQDLQGTGGNVSVERDSRGRLLAEVGSVSGRDGNSYILTIDSNIQFAAEKALADAISKYKADSGTVVAMHARTGAVLAMANFPTYNSNDFAKMAKEQQGLFRNPAISSRFEFGSVQKPFTIAMAIDNGLTTPDEKGSYPASLRIGDYTINNALLKGYDNITMTQALENSVNTAMVPLANRMGTDMMYKYLTALGFGQKTGIELSGEATGYLLPQEKMKDIQRATISYGQGIDTTTIQMTAAFTALANNGALLQPHIIDTVIHPDGSKTLTQTKVVSQVFKPETAKTLRDMMVSVVLSGHGRQAAVLGYKVAGKTGTAQIAKPTGGYYDDRTRHSFISIAPADDPVFVLFVTLENPKSAPYAESTAAPLAGEVMKYLLHYYQIPPTNK